MLNRNTAPSPPIDRGVLADTCSRRDHGRSAQRSDQVLHGVDLLGHDASIDGYLPSRQVDNCHAPRWQITRHHLPVTREPRPPTYTAIQKDVGNRIKWARELVEPNRAAFARLMGVDRTTLQKIEDGDRPPSIFNVLDLAHRLRVTPSYILDGSMRGIDGELAALLVARHPELVTGIPDKANGGDIHLLPKTPKRRAL